MTALRICQDCIYLLAPLQVIFISSFWKDTCDFCMEEKDVTCAIDYLVYKLENNTLTRQEDNTINNVYENNTKRKNCSIRTDCQ